MEVYGMKNYNKRIGELLKEAREEKGYTLREVGKIMGKDHTTISKWEQGKNAMLVSDLIKYCTVLDIDLDEFIKQL